MYRDPCQEPTANSTKHQPDEGHLQERRTSCHNPSCPQNVFERHNDNLTRRRKPEASHGRRAVGGRVQCLVGLLLVCSTFEFVEELFLPVLLMMWLRHSTDWLGRFLENSSKYRGCPSGSLTPKTLPKGTSWSGSIISAFCVKSLQAASASSTSQ